MIKKDTVIDNVRNSRLQILKFLGYGKRIPPKVVEKKISEELEKFHEYIDIEYEYAVHDTAGHKYADAIYTIGERLEKVINGYIAGGEAMRAMIMDKIGVVTLDEIKEEIIKEISMEYNFKVIKEIYPGSRNNPISMQKEILEEMTSVKNISINGYFQLYPVKSVALRMELSSEDKFYNPCEDCEIPCEAVKVTEEEAYRYFLEKSGTYTRNLYEKEKLAEDIYKDNMKDIDIWSEKYEKEHGKKGFYREQFEWIDSILEMKVIKLGRLQFELLDIGEQDNSTKNTLKNIKDFILVNVHIREDDGKEEKFNEEACEKSYNMAWKYYMDRGNIFSRIVFICDSWLINPNLTKLLSEESNIIRFQKRYNIISIKIDEEKPQIIERVFGNSNMKSEDFPERTALQIRLKTAWEKGERFPMAKGYFVFERLQEG